MRLNPQYAPSNSSGTLVAHYEYGPFGQTLVSTGTYAAENPFRFSTKYTDPGSRGKTDLVYYGYRYYDSEMGRWLNRDPIGERGGLNLYGFVGNDGVYKVDVMGTVAWLPMAFKIIQSGFNIASAAALTWDAVTSIQSGQAVGYGVVESAEFHVGVQGAQSRILASANDIGVYQSGSGPLFNQIILWLQIELYEHDTTNPNDPLAIQDFYQHIDISNAERLKIINGNDYAVEGVAKGAFKFTNDGDATVQFKDKDGNVGSASDENCSVEVYWMMKLEVRSCYQEGGNKRCGEYKIIKKHTQGQLLFEVAVLNKNQ